MAGYRLSDLDEPATGPSSADGDGPAPPSTPPSDRGAVWTSGRKDGRPVRLAATFSPWAAGPSRATDVGLRRRGHTTSPSASSSRPSASALLAVQREVTQVLVEQNQQLRELTQMKDDVVATVSHELRTPLTSIRGFVELLLDDDGAASRRRAGPHAAGHRPQRRPAPPGGRGPADRPRRRPRAAGGLRATSTCRPWPPRRSTPWRPARPDRGIAAGRRDLRAGHGPRRPAPSPPAAWQPALQRRQVHAAGGPGGRPGRRRSGPSSCSRSSTPGPASPTAEREQLFERFYRLASASEQGIPGSGLGLAIAKSVVEAHAGTIEIVDMPGWSTTFRGAPARRRPAPTPPGPTARRGPQVGGDGPARAAGTGDRAAPSGRTATADTRRDSRPPAEPGAGGRRCLRTVSRRRPRARRGYAQVRPGPGGGHPAARGALDQALLEQERLVGVLDGVGLLPHALRQRGQAHRLAAEAAAERVEDGPVDLVQARARPRRTGPGPPRRCGPVTTPSPRTSTKSRTRRSSRLAIRGVPRDRSAMRAAPSASTRTPSRRADRSTMACSSVGS